MTEAAAMRSVCVVGLGYVGLTLAVALCEAGFQVHGVERNPEILRSLKAGRAHFFEVGLNERLEPQLRRRQFTFAETLTSTSACDCYIITVGTPAKNQDTIDYSGITSVASAIASVLADGNVVILRSTVSVGTTQRIVKPILDRAGVPYDLAFCPERTLEGDALRELSTLPQLVGGATTRATERAAAMFRQITSEVVAMSSPEAAELAKLMNNCERDVTFALANELAAICDTLGLSSSEVTAASSRNYPRSRLASPGPVGGPCLEKDTLILAESLKGYDKAPDLMLTARRWNRDVPKWSVDQIAAVWRQLSPSGSTPRRIALLGAAFKGQPPTDDLRGTMAIPLLARLRETFPTAEYVAFDPVVRANDLASLGVEPQRSIEDAITGAAIVVIQNNHKDFANLDVVALLTKLADPAILYDFWGRVRRGRYRGGRVLALGFGEGVPSVE